MIKLTIHDSPPYFLDFIDCLLTLISLKKVTNELHTFSMLSLLRRLGLNGRAKLLPEFCFRGYNINARLNSAN